MVCIHKHCQLLLGLSRLNFHESVGLSLQWRITRISLATAPTVYTCPTSPWPRTESYRVPRCMRLPPVGAISEFHCPSEKLSILLAAIWSNSSQRRRAEVVLSGVVQRVQALLGPCCNEVVAVCCEASTVVAPSVTSVSFTSSHHAPEAARVPFTTLLSFQQYQGGHVPRGGRTHTNSSIFAL